MIKFLKKHILKPDVKFTHEDALFLAAVMSIPFMLFVSVMLIEIKQDLKERDNEMVHDRCRIKYVIVNEDYTMSYICKSETIGSIQEPFYYVVDEGDSEKVDSNPYINRPVKIYKNGKRH